LALSSKWLIFHSKEVLDPSLNPNQSIAILHISARLVYPLAVLYL